MNTYIFDGTFDGLICVAVSAFKSKIMPDRVLSTYEDYQAILFEEEHSIATDKDLAKRGREYLGKTLLELSRAFILDTDPKYLEIVKCLIGLYKDLKFMERMELEEVSAIHKASKRVGTEAHRMIEFVRFQELSDGVLVSEIQPKANILTWLTSHFKKRIPNENWMIYDSLRCLLLTHIDGKVEYHANVTKEELPKLSDDEEKFQDLWRVFFTSISIKERENYNLQRHFVPLYYRSNMPEFC